MDSKGFMLEDGKAPFFLMYSLAQAHTPMINSPRFDHTSKRGILDFIDNNLILCYVTQFVYRTIPS